MPVINLFYVAAQTAGPFAYRYISMYIYRNFCITYRTYDSANVLSESYW